MKTPAISLAFTLGNTKSYERYIVPQWQLDHGGDGVPRKDVGGSVWPSYEEAVAHKSPEQSVWGVLLIWELDVVPNPQGAPWYDLAVARPLIRLPEDFAKPLI